MRKLFTLIHNSIALPPTELHLPPKPTTTPVPYVYTTPKPRNRNKQQQHQHKTQHESNKGGSGNNKDAVGPNQIQMRESDALAANEGKLTRKLAFSLFFTSHLIPFYAILSGKLFPPSRAYL